jgi:phosphatidylinositol kinase/protein kinase (PI-3  family)
VALQVLWLKSRNSEVWLDRRTNYTRSTAVMSMVGYLLGLGDRHPSNLMLDRFSGKLVHIDFGDCFEASMTREKFPERVPFRLTRMMVTAMEVSGTEGNFSMTCDLTMNVLREEKISVMAMLEAFVFDPLINWRLLHPRVLAGNAAATAAGGTQGGGTQNGNDGGASMVSGNSEEPALATSVEQLQQVCAAHAALPCVCASTCISMNAALSSLCEDAGTVRCTGTMTADVWLVCSMWR